MSAPLLVFGEDWGGHPSSSQHLVRRLMRERDVVWVNSLGLRRPRFTSTDFMRLVRKSSAALLPGPSYLEPEGSRSDLANVVSPLCFPVPRRGFERGVNRIVMGSKLRKALRQTAIGRPILWTSLPTAVDFLGCADERAVIYYCGDDFASLAGVDHDAVTKAEARLVARADLILVASDALKWKFPTNKTVHLPHGVDLELFSAPCSAPDDLPLGQPVAGFYGSLSDWLDVELVDAVAEMLPDWKFVFIGKIQTDITLLKTRPNVTFLGPRAHHDLPAYAQNWTVSLLPFRRNAQIESCNPLKLREYLAAGTPVVSTDFPALDGYRDLIDVEDRPDQFAQAIKNTVNDTASRVRLRRNRVMKESWEDRAHFVASLLDRF